jgi:hypothetical protein
MRKEEDLTVQKGLEYAPVTKVHAGLQISMMILTNTKKEF